MGLFGKKKSAIGIDISDYSIELIQLVFENGEWQISALSRELLPSGIIGNAEILDESYLKKVIQHAIEKPKKGKFDISSGVVYGVPDIKIFTHTVYVPDQGKMSVEDILPNEFLTFIPFSLQEIYWGYKLQRGSDELRKYFVAASPKTTIDDYRKVFTDLGLKMIAFEIQSQALERALIKNITPHEAVLLVDVGTATTVMSVHTQEGIQTTHSLPIGGLTFTHSIAKNLSIPLKKAEIMKRKYGMDSAALEGRICMVLQQEMQSVISEVAKTIAYSKDALQTEITKVVLAGGSSMLKDFDTYLKENINLPVGRGALWIKNPGFSLKDIITYGVAIGLALYDEKKGKYHIDFLKKIEKKKEWNFFNVRSLFSFGR